MAEYINEDNPIIIKNETDSDLNVGAGIVFRKSGIHEITITDSTITVTKISERKTGKWIKDNGDWFETMFRCSECGALIRTQDKLRSFFCYHCGARMEGE